MGLFSRRKTQEEPTVIQDSGQPTGISAANESKSLSDRFHSVRSFFKRNNPPAENISAVNDNEAVEAPRPLLRRAAATGLSLATAGALHAIRTPGNIVRGAAAAGRSLLAPETRLQTAIELSSTAALMAAKFGATRGIRYLAGTTAAAAGATAITPLALSIAGLSVGTGIVGGLFKSNRQYKAARAEWEADSENTERFLSRRRYLWENKKQFGKNFLGSAFTGALGATAGVVIGSAIDHWRSAADVPQTAPAAAPKPSLRDLPAPAADASKVTLVDPQVHTGTDAPVRAVDPQALDKAIAIIQQKRDLSADIRNTIELAQQGDKAAIMEIADIIDHDGNIADDKLIPDIRAMAENIKPPSPSLASVDPLPSAEPRAPVPATPAPDTGPSIFTAENAALAAGGGLLTAGAGLGGQSLLTNSLGQPLASPQAREQARVERVLMDRAQGFALLPQNKVGLDTGTCVIDAERPGAGDCMPKQSGIMEGDFYRVKNASTGQEMAVIMTTSSRANFSNETFMKNSLRCSFGSLASGVGITLSVEYSVPGDCAAKPAETPAVAYGIR